MDFVRFVSRLSLNLWFRYSAEKQSVTFAVVCDVNPLSFGAVSTVVGVVVIDTILL